MKRFLFLTMMLAAVHASGAKVADCTIGETKARCGTYTTAEKPGASRTIDVTFVVLPALEKNDSAIVPMAGGPGDSVVDAAPALAKITALRKHHDILLIDERGTGKSAPLDCKAAMLKHRAKLLGGEMFPLDFVKDCRAELETSGADMTAYTYPFFADDVEAIRKALGYGAIDLLGGSYGTRAALTYFERYPASVRTIVLAGPLPPNEHPPLNYGRDAQESLNRLVEACKADKECNTKYPQFGYETSLTASQAALNPLEYSWEERQAGKTYMLRITQGTFSEWLRTQLYSTETMAALPNLIHTTRTFNYRPLFANFVDYRDRFYEDFGLFMTVTCMSDVRYINKDDIPAAVKGNFVTNHRIMHQIAACEQWTPGTVPIVKIPQNETPILIITADSDPVTPKRNADAIAKAAKRSKTVVLANSSHAEPSDCADAIIARFVDSGSLAKVDDSCAKTIKRPAFK